MSSRLRRVVKLRGTFFALQGIGWLLCRAASAPDA